MSVPATDEEALLGAPFTRNDKYGVLGMGPISVWEKLRLVLLALTVLPIKLVGAMAALLSFWLCCRLSFLCPASVRSDAVAQLGKWHCRVCLFFLGFWRVSWVQVDLKGSKGSGSRSGGGSGSSTSGANGSSSSSGAQAVGIVSNHISWCDILLHMSHSFPAFVARDKTRHTPFIGIISQLMGCLYVNRDAVVKDDGQPRVSDLVRQRMDDMAAGRLPHARPLLLFPEGTTTNGRYLLPFRTGAFVAGQPLQPVVIRYGEGNLSPAWEMIPAARHIFLMLCNPLHSVTAYQLPVYQPSEAEQKDPKLYAQNVRALMMNFSGLRDTRATYADKMVLMKQLKEQYGLE